MDQNFAESARVQFFGQKIATISKIRTFSRLSGVFLYVSSDIMTELQSPGSGILVFLINCVLLFEFGLKGIKINPFLKSLVKLL